MSSRNPFTAHPASHGSKGFPAGVEGIQIEIYDQYDRVVAAAIYEAGKIVWINTLDSVEILNCAEAYARHMHSYSCGARPTCSS